MWIISKSHREIFFFLIFLQSIHQVDMKNVVKWAEDFFPYFEALYTNSVWKDSIINIVVIFQPNILRIVGLYVRHSAYVRRSAIM